MTAREIEDGKAAFQHDDLMDYGSFYGVGSYVGENYIAKYLVRLGWLTENNIARMHFGKSFSGLDTEDQAAARAAMRRELKSVDLNAREARLPTALAAAVATVQSEITQQLLHSDFVKGRSEEHTSELQSRGH